jgi:neutral ceramidase
LSVIDFSRFSSSILVCGYNADVFPGSGLRQRLYSRAFIVGDITNPADRFVYISADIASGDTAIRHGVLQALANLGPAYSVYTQKNVAIVGTHSHSGPGAYFNYLLPQITSLGFYKESYQAIVGGAVLSIKRAHESLAPGFLAYADMEVVEANINRSPSAYLANPAEERAKYQYDVDKTMTVLRFQRESDGLNTGILAWHNVHATAM